MISGWVLWRLYLCSPSADHRHSCYYAQTEVDFYLLCIFVFFLCICVFVYLCICVLLLLIRGEVSVVKYFHLMHCVWHKKKYIRSFKCFPCQGDSRWWPTGGVEAGKHYQCLQHNGTVSWKSISSNDLNFERGVGHIWSNFAGSNIAATGTLWRDYTEDRCLWSFS